MLQLDEEGVRWEIVVGRESWGAFYAIFVPHGVPREIRQTSLSGTSYEEAYHEIEALAEQGLRGLFARSTPKSME